MKNAGFIFIAMLILSPIASAQEPIGLFDDHQDIGLPGYPGMVEYDDSTGQYLVDAVGATIGYRSFEDECHYAFKTMSGSFAIEANPFPYDDMGRGGLMIRQTLDPDSIHISLLMTSTPESDGNSDLGSVFPTFRTLKGGGSVRDGDPDAAPGGFTDDNTGPIRLERIGNSVHMYRKNSAGDWVWFQSENAAFEEEVLAGLAATAEDTDGLSYFEFTDVVIEELPLNVMRDLPTGDYEKGATLTGVTLTAKARSQVAVASIQEVLPVGAKASNIQASAGTTIENPDGTLSWEITEFSGEATLTYDVVLSSHDLSAAWRGVFTDGVYRESYIGGESLLPQNAQFNPPEDPIDVDPEFPTIIQAEQGFWLREETDFGLMFNLNSASGLTVLSMNTTAQALLEYPINILESGTYYFFGRVRGEDGNSDSFHFEIDGLPAGDNTSRWNISASKSLANEWVSSEDPREDPRALELDAGEHYFYLGNREDSASIDWFCITTNPNLGIASFDEQTEFFLSRSIPNRELTAGETYAITITRQTSADFSAEMSITETPPEGWTISEINASGGTASTNDQGQIVWTLSGVAGSQTLAYTAAPPSGDIKGGLFEGIYSYDGQDLPLPGDNVISQSFAFEKVNVANPTPVQLVNGEAKIEAEDAYLLKSTDADPFSVRFHPDSSQELYAYTEMSNFDGISGDELNFVFEVVDPGTYRAIARSRTPNGEDDSFYVGMDDDIDAVIPGYRFQGKIVEDENGDRIYDDNFNVSWLDADEAPDLSWDLSAGVHTLRIHIREDGSMIDWVMLTNNLDQDPSDLDPNTSIDHFMLY